MSKITVLGAGGWGMALAISACNSSNKVTIWSPFDNEIEYLKKNHGNERLLPGIVLPDEIEFTGDLSAAENSEITIVAVPSVAVESVVKNLRQVKNPGIIVNVAKGFEPNTQSRLSLIFERELPDRKIVVLSGPSHAEEVARNIPTSIVAASKSRAAAEIVQNVLSSENLRIYTSDDIVGVELGGALKNVIAICCGFCNGLGLGDNTKAALITRGLAEMIRLGVCMGARESTFAGLTGIGDLVVTCLSVHSRNNRFGTLVGKGVSVNDALKQVGTVEGYYACDIAYKISREYKIEMPIIEQCHAVLFDGKSVSESVKELMNRPSKSEN